MSKSKWKKFNRPLELNVVFCLMFLLTEGNIELIRFNRRKEKTAEMQILEDNETQADCE